MSTYAQGKRRPLLIVWRSYRNLISDKIKRDFSQNVAVAILLYGWTTIDVNETHRIKAKCELHKNAACCFEQIPGSNTPQNSSCMAICLPSHKPTKSDEQDMRGTAREVKTNSKATIYYGLLHKDAPVLADQQRLTYISSVRILDAI